MSAGKLASADSVAIGSIDYQNVIFRGSLDVDIVDTDSGSSNNLEVLPGLNNWSGDLTARSYNNRIVILCVKNELDIEIFMIREGPIKR